MATNIGDINDGGLPRWLSGLGQTKTGKVFDDGPGTVTVLKQGVAAPHQVKQMQMLLNQYGYKLSADGIFGAGTAAAVKAIQQKLKMSVTGIYDKALDDRVTGMNQSGIIDAKPADVVAVAVGQAQPQTGGGVTTPPKPAAGQPGSSLAVTTVRDINGNPVGPGGQLLPAPAGASFMEKMKAGWTKLLADPNFKYYAAGAVVVGVGGLFVLTTPKKDTPRTSQVQGYDPRDSRPASDYYKRLNTRSWLPKKRKSKKSKSKKS